MVPGGAGQSYNKTHTNFLPLPRRDGERLQGTCYLQMTSFDSLARVALRHIFSNFPLHPGPPIQGSEVMIHLVTSGVHGKLGNMSFVQDFLPEFWVFGNN
jgi:hypothetical protein